MMMCSGDSTGLPDDLDAVIRRAIQQHEEWLAKAAPSVQPQPRVIVGEKGSEHEVSRRPFRRRGRDGQIRWVVRYAGFARLTCPFTNEHGRIIFRPDWS